MKLEYDHEELGRFCRIHGIQRMEAFGSALGDDFRPASDLDLLATLRPDVDVRLGILEWVSLKNDLERIFGRRVDLLDRQTVLKSRNPYRRTSILERTETLYVEG